MERRFHGKAASSMPSMLKQHLQSQHDSRTQQHVSRSRPREILDLTMFRFRVENVPESFPSHSVLYSLILVVSRGTIQGINTGLTHNGQIEHVYASTESLLREAL